MEKKEQINPMLLSLVVPVYNVEKYLTKCLYSILHTNWQSVKYEIIIVNDDSPDGSLAIAQEYARQYPEIKIISQPNKGLGGARNTGITAAHGKYLFFLDSDDYLVNDGMPTLVSKALQQNVDILEFSAITVREDHSLITEIFPVNDLAPVPGLEYFGRYQPSNSVCNKLYKREFLLQNHIRFMEKVYVEDAPFNVEAYSKASSVASYPLVPVAFLQNASSITRQKRTGAQMNKFINDSIKVTTRMATFLSDDLPHYPSVALKKKLAVFVSGTLLMIVKSEKSYPNKIVDVETLKSLNLYPMKFSSGIWQRDLFLTFLNYRLFFWLAATLFSLKYKLKH